MGFRYRRQFRLLPGVKLNVTRRNVGVTVGGKAARVSRNTNGRVTRSLSLPVRGLSHQQVRSHRRKKAAAHANVSLAKLIGVLLLITVMVLLLLGVLMLSMLTR